MNMGSVELFVDRGPEKKEETDQIFDMILKDKEQIETSFGEELEWDKKEGRRVCRIKSLSKIGGLKNTDLWEDIQKDMIGKMKRLENTLKPIIAKIK